MARPIPRVEPATTAIFPVKDISAIWLELEGPTIRCVGAKESQWRNRGGFDQISDEEK